jgi:hypothetical protein
MSTKNRVGKPRALSLDQAADARRRYVDAGTSPALLASQFNVSCGTMLAVLMCTGTYAGDGEAVKQRAARYRGHQKLSDQNVRDIRTLRSEGVSYEDLGVRFGINPGTAVRVVTRSDRFALIDPHGVGAENLILPADESKDLLVAQVENMMLAGQSAAEIVDFVSSHR